MVEYIYATLSMYARSEGDICKACELIGVAPDKKSESRNGAPFSIHFTTDGHVNSTESDVHFSHLIERLHSLAGIREKLVALLPEVTLWVYVEPAEKNSSFGLSPTIISWLHAIGAEIRVDIWDRAIPDSDT